MIITEIAKFPNSNIIRFYVREKITPKDYNFRHENWDKEIQQEFVKQLFKLDGIIRIDVHPYEVSVYKAHSYSWEELESKIIKILEDYEGEPNIISDLIMFPFNVLNFCFGLFK